MGVGANAAKLLLTAGLGAAGLSAQLRAGAAKVDITPDPAKGPVYMAGFDHNRVATGVHDPLWARCAAFAPARRTLVMCTVDTIGLFYDDVEAVRRKLPYYDVVVSATHNHEGPDTMGLWGPAPDKSGLNEAYNAFVVDKVVEAAKAAVKSLQPATATLARVRTPELDRLIHDTRPPEVHDAELVVLAVADESGHGIATAVNWANHPETLGGKNTQITADYPGYLYVGLEEHLGGVAMLWNGAIGGMQSPLGAQVVDAKTHQPAPEESFRKAELIGQRVADLALDALQGEKPVEISRISFVERLITIPITNPGFQMASQADLYKGRKKPTADGGTSTPVGLVRFASRTEPLLDVALVPGEMYPELSVGGVVKYEGADFPDAPVEPPIKPMMTAEHRMVIGLADDEIGYIIPKAEWDEKAPWLQNAPKAWYGEVNSVGPEAAPRIAAAIRALLLGR